MKPTIRKPDGLKDSEIVSIANQIAGSETFRSEIRNKKFLSKDDEEKICKEFHKILLTNNVLMERFTEFSLHILLIERN